MYAARTSPLKPLNHSVLSAALLLLVGLRDPKEQPRSLRTLPCRGFGPVCGHVETFGDPSDPGPRIPRTLNPILFLTAPRQVRRFFCVPTKKRNRQKKPEEEVRKTQ